MNNLKEWFSNLEPREQKLVSVGGVVGIVLLFIISPVGVEHFRISTIVVEDLVFAGKYSGVQWSVWYTRLGAIFTLTVDVYRRLGAIFTLTVGLFV